MHVVNTYVPGIPSQAEGIYFMAVLTSGDETQQDYAVYIGLVGLTDVCSEEQRDRAAHWVAFNGTKQSYSKALAYFPSLDEEKYRA